MPKVAANGTDLYYEVRGSGPAVLLVMGAAGDGGHFDRLADLLADEFTVFTYDRRQRTQSRPGRLDNDVAAGAGRRRGRPTGCACGVAEVGLSR